MVTYPDLVKGIYSSHLILAKLVVDYPCEVIDWIIDRLIFSTTFWDYLDSILLPCKFSISADSVLILLFFVQNLHRVVHYFRLIDFQGRICL